MKFLGKFAPAAVIAAALVVIGGTATASSLITTAQIENGAVTSAKIANGGVHPVDLTPNLLAKINEHGKDGATGANGSSGAPAFVANASHTYPETVVQGIGDSQTHTLVDRFTVPAGTYLVSINADFYKVNSTAATPVLQVALVSSDPGHTNGAGGLVSMQAETGTFPSGSAVGTVNGVEQSATAFDVITLTQAEHLSLTLFGYNVDRTSTDGSGDFAAVTHITMTQVNDNHAMDTWPIGSPL